VEAKASIAKRLSGELQDAEQRGDKVQGEQRWRKVRYVEHDVLVLQCEHKELRSEAPPALSGEGSLRRKRFASKIFIVAPTQLRGDDARCTLSDQVSIINLSRRDEAPRLDRELDSGAIHNQISLERSSRRSPRRKDRSGIRFCSLEIHLCGAGPRDARLRRL
jgi:hypothetical protein